MNNQVRMLHPEQEKPAKPAYSRMPGEPAKYFLLFKRYCQLGRKRSLQALWDEEHAAQTGSTTIEAQDGQFDTLDSGGVKKLSVSGAWKRASVQWQWLERAQIWDNDQRQVKEQRLQEYLDHDAECITRVQRINLLDCACGSLVRWIHDDELMRVDPKYFQWAVKQIQSLLRDIRVEMRYFEK